MTTYKFRFITGLLLIFLVACSATPASTPVTTSTAAPVPATASATLPAPTSTPAFTATPQPFLPVVDLGPEQQNFPANVNPLTARAVSDPSLLGLPALLVSISNMPVTARPQAGPAFASWVFELFIGKGASRFMNVFYGEYPRIVPNVTGGCAVSAPVLRSPGAWIGNRVWLDENQNGAQDDWEFGVGGVCVRLLAASSRAVLAETTTDSNGYYAFDLPATDVLIQFVRPEFYEFTSANIGAEDHDSDADPSGETVIFRPTATASYFDAGLLLASDAPIATPSIVPPNWFIPNEPYVGPIRSGRLTYNQIGKLFPNSCLVYASAAWDIGERLDACEIVRGADTTTPNSALLKVTRLRELAEENLNPKQPVNYSGNLFSYALPPNGQPADALHIYYHSFTQSGWQYDPVSQTYLRSTDQADGKGELAPANDRLTGRQMAFENVIVLFAEHERFRHNQFEINLRLGQKGWAWLFRDGQAFKIQWSTLSRDWEQTTGLLRPIHFVDSNNNLIPLRPGRTWIHLVTPYSAVINEGDGNWRMQFVEPIDPLDTPTPEPSP
jgi:hypothetical protein